LIEGQPLKNIVIDADFSNHPRQHEFVMESMITIKTSTPLYKGSSTNMLASMLRIVHQ
jgi:hypothetical protein